jgi:hypothetical protein
VPPDASVAIVSKGDQALLQLDGRHGWHFPSDEDGTYLGYHPEDGTAAVRHLDELRGRGVDYLVLPSTAFWWLEHYPELHQRLRDSHRMVAGEESCLIFGLSERALAAAPVPAAVRDVPQTEAVEPGAPIQDLARSLLPRDAVTAVLSHEGGPVALQGARSFPLPTKSGGGVLGHLGAMVMSGVEYLVVPSTELDWLDRHPELHRELETRHTLVTRQRYVCAIYQLSPAGADGEAEPVVEAGAAEEQQESGGSLVGRLVGTLLSRGRDGT